MRRCYGMPNIKSAKKRVKVISAKTLQNKMIKTNLKTVLKNADAAVTAGAEDKEAAIRLAIKKVDQAAAKGIMHKKNADRKKSQLAKKLNAAKA
jgi:small subunit ribosomal protein S20